MLAKGYTKYPFVYIDYTVSHPRSVAWRQRMTDKLGWYVFVGWRLFFVS